MTLSKSLLWRFSKDETRVFHFPLSGSQWQVKHLLSKTGAVCYSGWSKVSNRLFLHEAARGDGGRSLWAVKPGPRAGSPQRGRHLPRGGAARRGGGLAGRRHRAAAICCAKEAASASGEQGGGGLCVGAEALVGAELDASGCRPLWGKASRQRGKRSPQSTANRDVTLVAPPVGGAFWSGQLRSQVAEGEGEQALRCHR